MAEEKTEKKTAKIQAQIDTLFSIIGALTKVQRLLICIGTILLIGGGFYYFIFAPKLETLKLTQTELENQQKKLAIYKAKARSLKKVEKQMAEAQERYNIAMTALPDNKELPSLLDEISKAGKNAGLEVQLFQPEAVVTQQFYKEIPLSMTVQGRYHQMADFFFQVAGLNRIVNVPTMSMKPAESGKGKHFKNSIQMKCSAVTYMFSEQKQAKGKGKKGKKSKRG